MGSMTPIRPVGDASPGAASACRVAPFAQHALDGLPGLARHVRVTVDNAQHRRDRRTATSATCLIYVTFCRRAPPGSLACTIELKHFREP